ncbi:hypothetical protein [Bradyrhizobium sp. CB3481]|uniref:glycosyltransferase n=1 Tax=Bradyrhizobium sp. CB3481 TaxID=3039158 RepID=UPI0024B2651D|nr:hypothetical protein [Bradyrhizobium sp. CB3481]WFU18950.1 hypothetical protein QA643_11720 [Bradyrhizobium sp. CB3481]
MAEPLAVKLHENGRRRLDRIKTLPLWFRVRFKGLLGSMLKFRLFRVEREIGLARGTLSGASSLVIAQRRNELLIHVVDEESARLHLTSGVTVKEAVANIRRGAIEQVILIARVDGRLQHFQLPKLLCVFRRHPRRAAAWLEGTVCNRTNEAGEAADLFATIRSIRANEPLIDFLGGGQLPFEIKELMPSYLWAEPKKRSAVLLNNCYYYYEVLAAALRRRGWEVRTASFEPPDSPSRKLYWNREEIIYDPDPIANRRKAAEFFHSVVERFGAIQLYGQFQMSCFRENWSFGGSKSVPWDFLEMRRRGIVVGYTPNGCLDGARQSSIRRVSGDMCSRCVLEDQPSVCSDELNGDWAKQLDLMCDWVGLENDYAVDERAGPRYVRRPIVTGLDPSIWTPELTVPREYVIDRRPDEILVYHAFANRRTRQADGRDSKGSAVVVAAIERLQREGVPIKLFYATDVPITEVRFYQVQADIVVDQLYYGRLGSNAREALMLGRPLVTRLETAQEGRAEPLDTMSTVPAIPADEATIYDVLRRLVRERDTLHEIGKRSREYALKWHSDDVCAARFERVVDRARAGLAVDIDEHPGL